MYFKRVWWVGNQDSAGEYNRMYVLSYIFLSVYGLSVIAFASTAHIFVASILLMCVCISTEYQFGNKLCYFDTCFHFF